MRYLIGMIITLVGHCASAAVIVHGTGTFDTENFCNSSDFNRAEFFFAQEFADTITITNEGVGFAHSHSSISLASAEVEVFDGSNWITVFSTTIPAHPGESLATLFPDPITFGGMLISGLRLDSVPFQNWTYHSVNAAMLYTTSVTGAQVPEPTSLALLALGLAGIGFSRRKRSHGRRFLSR